MISSILGWNIRQWEKACSWARPANPELADDAWAQISTFQAVGNGSGYLDRVIRLHSLWLKSNPKPPIPDPRWKLVFFKNSVEHHSELTDEYELTAEGVKWRPHDIDGGSYYCEKTIWKASALTEWTRVEVRELSYRENRS